MVLDEFTSDNYAREYILKEYNGGSVTISNGFVVNNVRKIQTNVKEDFFHIYLFDENNNMIGIYTEFAQELFKDNQILYLYKNISDTYVFSRELVK